MSKKKKKTLPPQMKQLKFNFNKNNKKKKNDKNLVFKNNKRVS